MIDQGGSSQPLRGVLGAIFVREIGHCRAGVRSVLWSSVSSGGASVCGSGAIVRRRARAARRQRARMAHLVLAGCRSARVDQRLQVFGALRSGAPCRAPADSRPLAQCDSGQIALAVLGVLAQLAVRAG